MPYRPHSPEEIARLNAEIKRVENEISVKQTYLDSLRESIKVGAWYPEPAEFKKMIKEVCSGKV